jgi:hypothetical protein
MEDSEKMREIPAEESQEKREAFLKKYSTTTPSGHRTFDNEKYYNDMPTEDMVRLRDKTVDGLKKYPDFGTKFYAEFVEYLNKKLELRK